MGVSFLILLVALVPLASSRDLRTATKVNRRTAPDPLLVQLFNDPTVTSLSRQTPDDSEDVSASGSGMWTMSGDEPKTSDSDKTTETETIQNAPSSSDTTTAVELATDQSTANVGSGSGAEPAAAPTKTQTMTENETVETKDDSVTHEDTNGKKSSFIPAETQTVTDQVEEGDNDVRDSTAAPKGKAFDEKNMYDATIVKKDDVPKPNDVKATAKSVVVPSPDEQGGLAPLTDLSAPQNDQLQQPDQSQQLDQAQQVVQPPQMQQPQQDMAQMAMQPQQDMPQPAVQQPQPDMSQIAMQPQQDMAQAPQQPAAAPQSISPDLSMQGQAQAYAGQFQDPSQQQTTANAYGQMMPQGTDQTMMQGQANAPVAPVNPYSDLSMVGQQVDPQTGMPIAGMQAVPVFQGLKAKKVNLKEDECDDMYDSCPEMAKNRYCVDYTELMKVQCKKSCGFCKVKDESSASGSSAESSSSLLADSSASGSAMWNDDEDNELPIWRKSGIPSPGDKVVGESASGSATASDVWSSSASGANMIKGESDTVSYSSTAEDTTAKKEPVTEVWESGSGQQSEDFGSASGANLAEDLATGTVSKTEQVKPEVTVPKAKYSEIPVPRVIVQQQPAAEIYPRIDLKVIAKAVNAYKSTALRMLGEAIRDAAQEAEDKAVKRTNIPMPPATELLEKMGFPMEQPRSYVPPFPQPAANPYAQYYQQPVYGNNLQNFYTVQQNSVAKSETPKPKVQEPEPKKEDKSEEEESSADDPDKKSDIRDPFQYVRHMKAGQSMQPIESRPGASLAPRSHSNPIILFKNSQLSNEAAKKNAIPKAPKITPKQMLQAAAPAARYGIAQPQFAPNFVQPKSDVSLNNILNQDANLDQPAQEDVSQYEQQMPAGDNQLDSTMDDSAFMRSEMTTDDQTNNRKKEGDDDVNLRELRSFFPAKENKKKRKRNVKTN